MNQEQREDFQAIEREDKQTISSLDASLKKLENKRQVIVLFRSQARKNIHYFLFVLLFNSLALKFRIKQNFFYLLPLSY